MWRNFFTAFLFALTLFNCNRSPVGFDQLDRELSEPTLYQFNPSASACYQRHIANGSSINLILGKNQEYESRVLILFTLVDSLLDSLNEVRLVLKTSRYRSVPFTIHIIQQEWQEKTVSWLRTDSLGYWLNPGADFSELVIGQGTITADSTVIILSHIDSLVRNGRGLILIPSDTGFAFLYSCETANDPKIIYKYPKKERTFTASADASIIDTVNLNLGRNQLWVGGGYGFHTYLKFAIDTIDTNVTITDAELILHPAQSFLLTDTIEIAVQRLLEPYQEGLLTQKFHTDISAKTRFTNTDTVIKINLKNLVQFFSLNRDSNFGFILRGYPEYSSIFRIELKTDLANLPILKLSCILPPKGRF